VLIVPPAPNTRVQRTRVLLPAVARRSPLTRSPLGSRSVIVAALTAIVACRSAPSPLLVTVTTPRGVEGPFHVGTLSMHLLERSDTPRCGDCWSSGTIQLVRSSVTVKTIASGPNWSALGQTTMQGVRYCTNGLAFEVPEPGKYRLRLMCGDGREVTSQEFEVKK